jgi:hypothetical protein
MVMRTKLFITGLALIALTAMASAQQNNASQVQKQTAQPQRGAYIDADKNGICDYYETNGRFNGGGRRNGVAAAAPGRRGMAPGQGRGMRPAQGRGMGPGQGRGAAPGGRFYVDEDKNGICDLRENVQK